jgi:hypothetical protein
LTGKPTARSDLVFVVREQQVLAATVDVEVLAQEVLGHRLGSPAFMFA